MTVQELIDELQQVQDKNKPVVISHHVTRDTVEVDSVFESIETFVIDQ